MSAARRVSVWARAQGDGRAGGAPPGTRLSLGFNEVQMAALEPLLSPSSGGLVDPADLQVRPAGPEAGPRRAVS